MKVLFIYLLLLLVAGILPVTAQTRDTVNYVSLLQKSGPYNEQQNQTFPEFTYQSADDAHLVELRKTFNLDSVAGQGTDVERVIRLLQWMHNAVPHEDVGSLSVLNAKNIITTYRKTKYAQGCYGLSISMNEIFLSMGFKSRSVICFSGLYPVAHGGHVINAVYINSLNKWVWMDPQENAYVMDEHGNLLGIAEVRQRLIEGKPLVLNKTANYHNVPTKKEDYLYQFMAQHIYRMICPLNSEYNSQTLEKGKTQNYVELLPSRSVDPGIDGFETSQRKNYNVITYHTNNDLLFWKKP